MNKIGVIVGTATVSVVVGFTLLAYVPTTCACLDPIQDLVDIAGLDYNYPTANEYSSKEIEAGLNATLAGKNFNIDYPLTALTDCNKPTSFLIQCRVVTNGSLVVGRAFNIRFTIKPDGTFDNAQVAHAWVWL